MVCFVLLTRVVLARCCSVDAAFKILLFTCSSRFYRIKSRPEVFGGYERKSDQCFLIPVESRSAVKFVSIILEWIKPDTAIISGC